MLKHTKNGTIKEFSKHIIKPDLDLVACPGPKVGVASNLPSKKFGLIFFFQNSDLFRDVVIMISMID